MVFRALCGFIALVLIGTMGFGFFVQISNHGWMTFDTVPVILPQIKALVNTFVDVLFTLFIPFMLLGGAFGSDEMSKNMKNTLAGFFSDSGLTSISAFLILYVVVNRLT